MLGRRVGARGGGQGAGEGDPKPEDIVHGHAAGERRRAPGIHLEGLVQYEGQDADEAEFQGKITALLGFGTRFLGVVRLTEPITVEIFEAARRVGAVSSGLALVDTGVLRNPVPVDALYRRDAPDG